MQQRIRTYFIFSRRERKAAWLIVLLTVILLCIPLIGNVFDRAQPNNDQYALWRSLESRRDTSLLDESDMSSEYNYRSNTTYPARKFFYNSFSNDEAIASIKIPDASFDPNVIEEQEWIDLGVPIYVAQRITKYRGKGGTFRTVDDVKKIYGFPEDIFLTLAPYMMFSDSIAENSSAQETEVASLPEPAPIELNSATKLSLMAVGFSAGDAVRILRFREQAGGIYDPQQLFGVYGLDAERIQQALPWLSADKNSVIKINLNTTDSTTLANHIYISDVLAGTIVKYRQETGKFYSLSELLKVKGMYPALFEKLKPYLQI